VPADESATAGGVPVRRKSLRLNRGTAFLVGLSSGVLIVAKGRVLLKGGVKAGIRSGLKLREMAVRGAENLSDVTQEAVSELYLPDEHS
jgi:hypothetical protein